MLSCDGPAIMGVERRTRPEAMRARTDHSMDCQRHMLVSALTTRCLDVAIPDSEHGRVLEVRVEVCLFVVSLM